MDKEQVQALICIGFMIADGAERTVLGTSLPLPETIVTKPYDWTYTSTYSGHILSQSSEFVQGDPNVASHGIPIEELSRLDPILFYAEIPLYEDELHDNGVSQFSVRIVSALLCK